MTDDEKINQAAEQFAISDDRGRCCDCRSDCLTAFKAGIRWRDQNPSPKVLALVESASRLIERIDKNGGIGEYRGGPAFVVEPLREALKAWLESDIKNSQSK